MIIQYDNDVFTHDGQSTVSGFGKEVSVPGLPVVLAAVKPLKVYAGYHGKDPSGEYDRAFNSAEMTTAETIASKFTNVNLIKQTALGLTDKEIEQAVQNGKVFFTWCDSNNKVNNVMKKNMPKLVKKW